MNDAPLVRVRNISKRFPGVRALSNVDFELLPGEIHALVGENGSGKSTLCKCIYGTLQPDEGVIEVSGEPQTISTPHKALQVGIAAITQELTLAPTLSVTENILMGRLPHGRFGINWGKARELAREALAEVGTDIDETAIVGDLSVEQQQEVEIVRAVSANSRVIVLDEATSSLSEAATERLMLKMEQLRERGVAIIFVSHRLREIFRCASRATVLRDGHLVGTFSLAEVRESDLVTKMVGRSMEDLFGKRRITRGGVLMSVQNLSSRDGRVKNISFDLHRGEILGIAGLVGSGKVHVGRALFGAIPASGEVRIEGKRVPLRNPRAAMAAGIGYVPDDRKREALLPTRGVRPNLSLAWLSSGRFRRFAGILNIGKEKSLAGESCREFSVVTYSVESPIVQLSGGNQQKVILARWFGLRPKVIVLAEPTRGIDVGAKAEIYGFIQDMAEQGAAIIMISSEMPELLGVADRILVMYQGRICAEFDPKTSGEEDIAHVACMGELLEAKVS